MDLAATTIVLRLLSDPTRVRLLALLEREELTVAELAAITHLAQPRVSTHLAKLKEADLVRPALDRQAVDSACGMSRRHISHCPENLGYPRRILLVLQPRYLVWGRGVGA